MSEQQQQVSALEDFLNNATENTQFTAENKLLSAQLHFENNWELQIMNGTKRIFDIVQS